MAVTLDEVTVTAEVSGGAPAAAPASAAQSSFDEDEVRTRIAPIVRALIREELACYLRIAAD